MLDIAERIREVSAKEGGIEPWRACWRVGFAPVLETRHLLALKRAIEEDDPALVQGSTVLPLYGLVPSGDEPPAAACAIGLCGWKGGGLASVREVHDFFAQVCSQADERLGESSLCRYFIGAFDEWKRQDMRANLLPEVEREIERREKEEAAVA